MKINTPKTFDSNHQTIVATLYLQSETKLKKHLKNKTTCQLPLFIKNGMKAKSLFQQVCEAKPRTTKKRTITTDWISKETYELLKKKSNT
jgi:hypothetical protein